MVLKQTLMYNTNASTFENDVKMYGTQTTNGSFRVHNRFENDVKMYGTQTRGDQMSEKEKFENDVKMYGTQTIFSPQVRLLRLRMM